MPSYHPMDMRERKAERHARHSHSARTNRANVRDLATEYAPIYGNAIRF